MHENRVEFEVSGRNALFSDPVTRVGGEKCSYPIPTYEAIKGVLHSIYWKPTIIWVVDEVRVMNRIAMESKGIATMKQDGGRDLSYYSYLRDCRYQVRAHFIWNENRPDLAQDRNENKHHNIAKRCIAKGGRRDIFLGTRECQAYVVPCVFGEGEGAYDGIDLSFGRMYHGITYADEAYDEFTQGNMTVRFWNARMENGIIHYPKPEALIGEGERRMIHAMPIKPFGVGTNLKDVEEEENGLDTEML